MRQQMLWMLVFLAGSAISFATTLADEPAVCPHCGKVHPPGNTHNQGYISNSNHSNHGHYPSSGPGSNGNYGLPQGRRYNNGRYFGNFLNRYYGPQYGYF